jgi:glutamate formiminotransferase/formiminotetrahydrofolate cyclodeaminase
MPDKLVECVPNFSEGRREDVVQAIVAAMLAVPGVVLLDREMDADHNRCVITLAGAPEAVLDGAFHGIREAARRIDLNQHKGEHPRMGAADVVPFVPLRGTPMEECVTLAERLGRRVGEELELPVFLYERAARRPERRDLAAVRKGEFEGLREEIGRDPARDPDFGPRRIHPTAGAVAIGARPFLVAYNVNLRTADLKLAKEIAGQVREKGGGLRSVKALGFELRERGLVQVSMNLTDTTVNGMAEAYAAVARLAAEAGVEVVESEIVGLVPQDAVDRAAAAGLRARGFDRGMIVENRLAERLGPPDPYAATHPFLDALGASTPAPGGGSASALAAAMGAALVRMVAGVTAQKSKDDALRIEMEQLGGRAAALERDLRGLVREDAEAYDAYMKLKKAGAPPEEQERALLHAADVPLRVARCAGAGLDLAVTAAERGRKALASDAAVGAWLLRSGAQGAALNVRINLPGIADAAARAEREAEARELLERAEERFRRVEARSREALGGG